MGKVPLGEGAPKRFQLVLKIFALHESIGAQLERPAWHKHASAFFWLKQFLGSNSCEREECICMYTLNPKP